MEEVKSFILNNNLVKKGEVIGIGVSGGLDSMALLYMMNDIAYDLDIQIVAVHINHGIREESIYEEEFVEQKCKEIGVRFYKFRIDAPKIAQEKNLSLETAARDGRYMVFDALITKGIVDKIALAHHLDDQAETLLMHLFRGSGMTGAKGMAPIRDNKYIRPLLEFSKKQLEDYVNVNSIEHVEDESNADVTFNRNFIRNVVMKEVVKRWPNAVSALANFSKSLVEDDSFICSQIREDAVIRDNNLVQIPCSCFLYHNSVVTRTIFKALATLGIKQDIERKHIAMVKDLALNGENGKKIKLPNQIMVSKEYDYITIHSSKKDKLTLNQEFKSGEFEVKGFGKVVVKRVKDFDVNATNGDCLYFDFRKVPKTARWRFREDGDVFEKFGGGSKKLKSYLVDKKVPQRIRNILPVLADGNEVYVIAGVEISDKVRLDDGVTTCCRVEVKK
ncbi:MAG: tRNA lysidine(34) synthetase TilS [Clostridia bacterium]|nr:tRNA lysidine(34) synthetase TilS [Clostridia bacterium]